MSQELEVMEPQEQKLPKQRITNPLDVNPAHFKKALERRKKNRDALIGWVRDSLVQGVDYMRIWSKKRQEWSKPFLTKAGSEKVLAMLGLQPVFPGVEEYHSKVLRGENLVLIVVVCHLLDGTGNVVGIGAGGRSVEADYGDINKAMKMALKSAQIDATLRCAGLSEIFSQDPESATDDDLELPVTTDQLQELLNSCKDQDIKPEKVADFYGVKDLADLPRDSFIRAKRAILKAGQKKREGEDNA